MDFLKPSITGSRDYKVISPRNQQLQIATDVVITDKLDSAKICPHFFYKR